MVQDFDELKCALWELLNRMQLNKDGEFESLKRIASPKDRAEGQIQGELILYEGR